MNISEDSVGRRYIDLLCPTVRIFSYPLFKDSVIWSRVIHFFVGVTLPTSQEVKIFVNLRYFLLRWCLPYLHSCFSLRYYSW